MTGYRNLFYIVHPRTLHPCIRKHESSRFNNVYGNGHTRGETEHRADISGDFGLIERNSHGVRA